MPAIPPTLAVARAEIKTGRILGRRSKKQILQAAFRGEGVPAAPLPTVLLVCVCVCGELRGTFALLETVSDRRRLRDTLI